MMRNLKWLAIGIALLFGVLITGAWWATSSPKALQWLVAEVIQRSKGTLSFEGVEGSLVTQVKVRRMVYSAPDTRVMFEDVALELSRSALLQGRIELTTFAAALVDVQVADSDKPLQAPDSLALLFDIELNRVRIGQLRFKNQVIKQLAFDYRGGKAGHTLQGFVAETEWGRVSGEMKIAATRPFALSGKVDLDNPKEWNAQAMLSGDLLTTHIAARALAKGAVGDAKLQIAVFDPKWLRELQAHAEKINTAAFSSSLPESAIEIDIAGTSKNKAWSSGTVTLKNGNPGTLTDNKLPLHRLSSNYALQDATTVALSNIAADLGAGGTLSGKGHIAADASQLNLVVRALNLRALHAPLRTTRLNGNIKAELAGDTQKLQLNLAEHDTTIALNGSRRGDAVTLSEFRAQAGAGMVRGDGKLSLAGSQPFAINAKIDRLDPAAFGDYPSASITGQLGVDGSLAPQWRTHFSLTLANSLFRGERLAGAAAGEVTKQGAQRLKVDLAVGANRLTANGDLGRLGDALIFALDAPQLSQLDTNMAGAVTAKGRVIGNVTRPQLDIDVVGTGLVWKKKGRIDTLSAHASGSLEKHTAILFAKNQDFDLDAKVEGEWHSSDGWSGMLTSFQNRGIYPMQLLTPLPLAYARGRYAAGPAQLDVDGGRVALTTFSWRDGKLQTSGEVSRFPVAPLLAIAGMPAPRSTLRMGGAWSITASPLLNGKLTLARESGDVVTPGDTAIALGLERLGINVRFANGAADATLDLLAKTLSGNAHATATSMAPEGKLSLDGKFAIASLRVLDPLLGSQALLRGSAAVNIVGGGTLGAPQLNGSLAAANLSIEAPQYGVRLRNGSLRAELDEKALTLREFAIHGDEGTLSATGTMDRADGGTARLAWRADHLRVLNRPDMRLKFDGSGSVAMADKKLVLRGALTADEGRFEFDTPKAPKLGSDIVVVGRTQAAGSPGSRASFQTKLLDVDMTLDADERLHIVGAGLDTDLRGKVNLKTNPQGVLEARGVLSSVNGVYFVFGQRLEIDRGRLIFDGPIDNPALDISAKRKGLAVEAGVDVTGTVRVPNVQLTSDPPVSDSEKLAWLTLGHGLENSTGADLALLQTAASALIGAGNAVPITQRIANQIGLDELSLRGGGEAGTQVAALGKRLSNKLYLEYQQGLATANNVLRLSYSLSRSLSLRLETGYTSGVGFYFTRSYD